MSTPMPGSVVVAPSDLLNIAPTTAAASAYSLPNTLCLNGCSAVVRDDYQVQKRGNRVAIVTGGGGGHEPFPFGFVGRGMATASVSGNIFSAPSEAAIVRTLLEVTGKGGALVVYLNFTGDRMSFSGAVGEAKRKYGLRVETICVGDDVSMEKDRRGLSGAIFLLKVAGGAAEAGAPLNQIVKLVSQAAHQTYTVGVGFAPVFVPGASRDASSRTRELHFEMGVGIHGETGVKAQTVAQYLTPAGCIDPELLVTAMVDALVSSPGGASLKAYVGAERATTGGTSATVDGLPDDSEDCALLVNNLGGLTFLEVTIIVSRAVCQLRERLRLRAVRVISGPLLTSLNMPGISLSIMLLNDVNRLKFLDRETTAPCFPAMQKLKGGLPPPSLVLTDISEIRCFQDTTTIGPGADRTRNVLRKICQAIIDAENNLTVLDTIGGDGDCGINFTRASVNILTALDNDSLPLVSVKDQNVSPRLFEVLGDLFAEGAGGSTGVLYSQILQEVANHICTIDIGSEMALASALSEAVTAVMKNRQVDLGMKSMIDSMYPAVSSFKKEIHDGKSVAAALNESATAAEEGAEATKGMEAKVGRGRFMPANHLVGHTDPGAYAVSVWVRALAEAMAA